MRGLVGLFIFVLGCHAQPGEETQDVCTVICRCQTPLPGEQAMCVDACVSAAPMDLPDTCVTCVFEHETSCADLETTCQPLCQTQRPPTGEKTWP
jgi:hypothetical protein